MSVRTTPTAETEYDAPAIDPAWRTNVAPAIDPAWRSAPGFGRLVADFDQGPGLQTIW